jgi:hypothetical protein
MDSPTLKFLQEQRAEIDKQLKPFEALLIQREYLDSLIAKIQLNDLSTQPSLFKDTKKPSGPSTTPPKHPKTIKGRITAGMIEINQFSHIRELGTVIYRPEKDGPDFEKFLRKLASPMSALKKEGVVFKYQYGGASQYTVWGLPIWTINGKPQPVYQHAEVAEYERGEGFPNTRGEQSSPPLKRLGS